MPTEALSVVAVVDCESAENRAGYSGVLGQFSRLGLRQVAQSDGVGRKGAVARMCLGSSIDARIQQADARLSWSGRAR